jgi:hypothetical protein
MNSLPLVLERSTRVLVAGVGRPLTLIPSPFPGREIGVTWVRELHFSNAAEFDPTLEY